MAEKVLMHKINGKAEVKLTKDIYGLTLWLKNNWQWNAFEVTPFMLALIKDTIQEYFDSNDNKL